MWWCAYWYLNFSSVIYLKGGGGTYFCCLFLLIPPSPPATALLFNGAIQCLQLWALEQNTTFNQRQYCFSQRSQYACLHRQHQCRKTALYSRTHARFDRPTSSRHGKTIRVNNEKSLAYPIDNRQLMVNACVAPGNIEIRSIKNCHPLTWYEQWIALPRECLEIPLSGVWYSKRP